jgi:hypothetical protein
LREGRLEGAGGRPGGRPGGRAEEGRRAKKERGIKWREAGGRPRGEEVGAKRRPERIKWRGDGLSTTFLLEGEEEEEGAALWKPAPNNFFFLPHVPGSVLTFNQTCLRTTCPVSFPRKIWPNKSGKRSLL